MAKRFDKPNGPILDALLALTHHKDWNHDLFTMDPESFLGSIAEYCQDEYSIDLLGRSHDGLCYFGVPHTWDAPTIDARPIVTVDNKGQDPEVVAKSLAEFLSLIAYSPATWGDSEESWKAAAAADLETWGDTLEKMKKQLCSIKGVSVAKAPWKKTRLPAVAFRAWSGGNAATREQDEEFSESVQKIFAEATDKAQLLLVFDGVETEGDALRVHVILDAPMEIKAALANHPIVREPLQAFLTSARAALPKWKIKIALSLDSLEVSSKEFDPWKSLQVALKLAGHPELYAELAKAKAKAKR